MLLIISSAYDVSTNMLCHLLYLRGTSFFRINIDDNTEILHIEIEQLDVMQRIYAPQGWLDEKNRREFILNNINSILAKFSQPRSQVELYNLINDKDPALIDLLYDLLKSTKDNPPIN